MKVRKINLQTKSFRKVKYIYNIYFLINSRKKENCLKIIYLATAIILIQKVKTYNSKRKGYLKN